MTLKYTAVLQYCLITCFPYQTLLRRHTQLEDKGSLFKIIFMKEGLKIREILWNKFFTNRKKLTEAFHSILPPFYFSWPWRNGLDSWRARKINKLISYMKPIPKSSGHIWCDSGHRTGIFIGNCPCLSDHCWYASGVVKYKHVQTSFLDFKW